MTEASPTAAKAADANVFHRLRIASLARDPADALHIALAVPAELADTFRHEPGQHVTVRVPTDGAEVERLRSFIADHSGPDGALALRVHRRLAPRAA